MADQEKPDFTVADKHKTQDETHSTPEPNEAENASSQASAPDDAAESPNVSETESSAGDEADSSQGSPFLPDPAMLLGMAGMQMEAKTFLFALLPIFDAHAWRAMGLVGHPLTGETKKDLPTAQMAIDCVQFVLGKIESELPDAERREAQRRLSDLRMNYVTKLREG